MDWIVTDDSKVIVRFNGIPIIGCNNDVQCPLYAICAKNETWAAYSQMCVCEADKTGLNCDEISSAGIGGIVLDTIAVILGFMTFFIALWNTWRLVKKDYVNILKRKQLSVLPSTSLFACLGALFVGLYSLEQVIFHSTPSAEIDSAELKRIHPAQGFMYTSVLAFFFVSLACLNTTLLFYSLAQDSERLSLMHQSLFQRYRIILIVYYFVFGILIIILCIVKRLDWAFYIAIPAIICVFTVCLVGAIKLNHVLKSVVGINNSKSSQLPATRILILMLRSSTALGISLFFVMLFAVIYTLTSFTNPLQAHINIISFALFWVSCALTQFIIVLFIHYAAFSHHNNNKAHSSTNSNMGKNFHSKDNVANMSVKVVDSSVM